MPTRFNPPPGWPAPPAGWTPPPGWQPDPAWPAAPQGWQFWVEDAPAPASAVSADWLWTIGGGAAVFLGSLLPWISVSVSDFGLGLTLGYTVNGGARAASAVFGLILLGLAATMRSRPAGGGFAKPKGYAYRIPFLVLSVLGFLAYGAFTAIGIAGFDESDGLGGQAHVTFTPSIGLILMLLGCAAAAVGGIRSLRRV